MISVCESCERCKKYISRACNGYTHECLHYSEEPRGKIITKPLKITCAEYPEMPIIKPKSKLELEGLGEVTVRRIESVDMPNCVVIVTADVYSELYYKAQESQMFRHNFRILRGGKE